MNINSQKTQRTHTIKTYQKIKDSLILNYNSVLDYGAGYCKGNEIFDNYESFEPFPRKDIKPTFKDSLEIPKNKYDLCISLNVLNVLETVSMRLNAIETMVNSVKKGGIIVIGVRTSSDVGSNSKTAESLGDCEFQFPNGCFQKGYTKEVLESEINSCQVLVEKCSYIKGVNPLTIKLKRLE